MDITMFQGEQRRMVLVVIFFRIAVSRASLIFKKDFHILFAANIGHV